MSIRNRLEDAKVLINNDRLEGALLSILIAVAATSRKRYQRPISDKEAFTRFLEEQMLKITGFVKNFNLKFRGKMITLQDLLYTFVRCELAHEAEVPSDIAFEKDKYRYSVQADKIILPYELINGLTRAVTEAPENVNIL